jgi:aminopeptidase-like protein
VNSRNITRSADNLTFVHPDNVANSFTHWLSILQVLENNRGYVNLTPMCEPQLGKRGLYRMIRGPKDLGIQELPLLWVLNLSDGAHSLLDIPMAQGYYLAS